jgi:hypothetical protein
VKTITVIQCTANDSMEDWVLDMMIRDTVEPFMEWGRQYPDNAVQFTRYFEPGDHYLVVSVDAEFKDDAVAAHFILEHTDTIPVNKLNSFTIGGL